MYAIIVSGGKQYRVTKGEVVKLEKLAGEVGSVVEFEKVLMIADGDNVQIGNPYVNKTKVLGEVVAQERADKIHIIKFRRRKHYMKHQGHRQYLTAVQINDFAM